MQREHSRQCTEGSEGLSLIFVPSFGKVEVIQKENARLQLCIYLLILFLFLILYKKTKHILKKENWSQRKDQHIVGNKEHRKERTKSSIARCFTYNS